MRRIAILAALVVLMCSARSEAGITFVASSDCSQTGSGVSTTCTKPVGTVDGDVVVACLALDASSVDPITLPAGVWTQIDKGISPHMYQYVHVASGDGASYTWGAGAGNDANFLSVVMRTYSGVNTTTPVDAHGVAGANSATPTTPSITTTVANDMLVPCYALDFVSGPFTPPAGFSNADSIAAVASPALYGAWTGDKTQAVAGPTGTFAGDYPNGADFWEAGIMALEPSAAPPAGQQIWVANNNYGGDNKILAFPRNGSGNIAPSVTITLTGSGASGMQLYRLAFDSHGNLWALDTGNDSVYEIPATSLNSSASIDTATLITVSDSNLSTPQTMAFDKDGNLWVADETNLTLEEWTAAQLVTGATTAAHTYSSSGPFYISITSDAAGRLYIGTNTNNYIRSINNTDVSVNWTITDSVLDANRAELFIFSSPAGDILYPDPNNNFVYRWDAGTCSSGTCTSDPSATISTAGSLSGLAIDLGGNIYGTDRFANAVNVLNHAGVLQRTISGVLTTLNAPLAVTLEPAPATGQKGIVISPP